MLDEVAATAAGLRRLGVAPEQRVAMVMLDSIEFYDVFLAALRIGAVPAPVNPLLPGRDLGGVVAASRATVLVVSAERAGELDAIRAAAPEVSTVVVTGSPEWDALVGGGADDGEPWTTWDESPGFWLCTSGSTGRPKLAMHRHIDLRVTADTYGAAGARRPRRTTAATRSGRCSTPTGWATRCRSRSPSAPRRSSNRHGRRPRRWSATSPARCSRRCCSASRRSTPRCAPSDLPADTFASVRWGVSAAEPLPADTYHRFEDRFGVRILDGIGSTEMTHIYISNSPTALRPGTSGRPVPGYHVEIVDDEGRPVAADVPGHLKVSGDSMAVGYWCDSAATRHSFGGDRMRTGDMYSCSDDGYYTYLGRSDDMLRVGGEWVSPAEVEAVLVRNPAVLEAAVVGYRDDEGLQRPRGLRRRHAWLRRSTRLSWRCCARPSWPGTSDRGATASSMPCRRRRPARSSATSSGRSV